MYCRNLHQLTDLELHDGTSEMKNANTGRPGWGVFVKHEQEITDDGRGIMVLRYGWSSNRSSLHNQQASAAFLLYAPFRATVEE